MIIDIRGNNQTVTGIRFAEPDTYDYYADQISPYGNVGIKIEETDSSSKYILIRNREHADNLIKAIEEEKRLGWI